MDLDFWLEPKPETHSNGNGLAEQNPINEETEHKKKKKEKKEKKHKREKKEKKKSKENGDASKESYDLISVDGGHYRPLAENSELKMFFELRKVPLDPDKLAAAVQVRIFLPRYVVYRQIMVIQPPPLPAQTRTQVEFLIHNF